MILGVDTTNQFSSVAIVDAGGILAYDKKDIGRGHAEILGPQVQHALKQAGLAASDITRIAACTGPGSFTGVRVGLSFAKGFALPRNVPIIGISGLSVMAATADPVRSQNVMAVQDVRRGEVFWQIFMHGLPVAAPRLTSVSEANHAAQDIEVFVGDGAHLIGKASEVDSVCPAVLAWLSERRSQNTHPALPLYHRPPDAKLPGGRSL